MRRGGEGFVGSIYVSQSTKMTANVGVFSEFPTVFIIGLLDAGNAVDAMSSEIISKADFSSLPRVFPS